MKLSNHTEVVLFGKKLLSAATLAAAILLASVPRASADDDDCRRRTARADHKLHEAIEHHGYNSAQADRRRHELQEARERCWRDSHQWWDEHNNRWHHDHDWDDHDHDHE